MSKTRVQFDLTQDRLSELEDVMAVCGFETKKELFNNALSFFEAAVEEAMKGNDIASINEDKKVYNRMILPALARARTRARQTAGPQKTPPQQAVNE